MQTPMFVIAGHRNQRSAGDTKLLQTQLNQSFAMQKIPISFTRKDELLSSVFEDVSFFVAFLKDKTDLKDWLQMARDFELTSRPNPIDIKGYEKRSDQKRRNSPNLYKEIHYSIGESIFTEMNKYSPVAIYLFN